MIVGKMLGSEVLLFPDFGEAFLRSLKTNAVYAKRIASPVLVIPEQDETGFSEGIQRALENRNEELPESLRPAFEYFQFVVREQPTLRLLVESQVLSAPTPASVYRVLEHLAAPRVGLAPGTGHAELWFDRFKSADSSLMDQIRESRRQMPPSLLDALPSLSMLAAASQGRKYDIDDFLEWKNVPLEFELFFKLFALSHRDDLLGHIPFSALLAAVNEVSEQAGTPIVCTDPTLQNGLWAAHEIVSSQPSHLGKAQRTFAPGALLGSAIVETHLPVVHDLPIEEILEFRTKHEAELEAFRSGIDELATSIDTTQSPAEIKMQCQHLVSSRVNPAVRELRAKLENARLEALQKIGKSWKSLASLTFSSTIAVYAGAPLGALPGILGLLGLIGQPLFDGEIERRKLMHASQWAALIRFDEFS